MSSSGIAWKIMQFLIKRSLQILLSWLNLLEDFEQRFLHKYEIMLYTNQQRNLKKPSTPTNTKKQPPKSNQAKPQFIPWTQRTSYRKFTALMMTKLHGMPLDAQTNHHYEIGNNGDKHGKEADAILSIIVVFKTIYFKGYQLKN